MPGEIYCVSYGVIYRQKELEGKFMIDKNLLEILACPICKKGLEPKNDELICRLCKKAYPIQQGIPVMLIEKARNL